MLILFCRAIDRLYPGRNRPLTATYIYNARPMPGAPETHHNCSGSINFTYTDQIRAMPLERQCTVHRGTTFLQSDTERVQGSMTGLASLSRMLKAQTAEKQKQAFGQILLSGRQTATTLVSYTSQWKRASLAPYIEEFWTHVPFAGWLFLFLVNEKFIRFCCFRSGFLDAHLLQPGGDFSDLPETFVIFITENDVIGDGLPLYTIDRQITNTGKAFDDGEHIIYVNGADKDASTESGKLMHDFFCTDPDDMHYRELADKVRYFKEDEKGCCVPVARV